MTYTINWHRQIHYVDLLTRLDFGGCCAYDDETIIAPARVFFVDGEPVAAMDRHYVSTICGRSDNGGDAEALAVRVGDWTPGRIVGDRSHLPLRLLVQLARTSGCS